MGIYWFLDTKNQYLESFFFVDVRLTFYRSGSLVDAFNLMGEGGGARAAYPWQKWDNSFDNDKQYLHRKWEMLNAEPSNYCRGIYYSAIYQ